MSKESEKFLKDILVKVVKVFAKAARDEVRRNVSGRIIQRRTGKLYQSIFFTTKRIKTGVKATIGSKGERAFVARFFELTGRKEVRPKTKRVLRIQLASGRVIFRGRAGPIHTKPFILPAVKHKLKQHKPKIANAVGDAILNAFPDKITIHGKS